MHFSRYKSLLKLSDEALELADRYILEEGVLRYVLRLPTEAHSEMIQQIVQFNLSVKQVKEICEQGDTDTNDDDYKPNPSDMRLIKVMRSIDTQTPHELAQVLLREEKTVHLARARIQNMMEFLGRITQLLDQEGR